MYIKRILDGETEFFAYFLNRYGRPIHSLVVQIVSSPEDAEEIVQDVFLKAFRKLDSYRGESAFSTWLYRIAYNTAVAATRRRKRDTLYIEEATIDNIPDEQADRVLFPTDDEEYIEKLKWAVDELTPEERAILTLFYYNGKSIEEISEITKLTASNVKVKLYRIRKKLYVLLTGRK